MAEAVWSSETIVAPSDLCHIDAYMTDHPEALRFLELCGRKLSLGPAPRFVFGPVPQYLAREIFGEFVLGSVGCYVIKNGRLTTDAVIVHGRTALWSHGLNHPDYHVANIMQSSGFNRESLPARYVSGQAAAIYGPGFPVYGHWLVDFLPRLHVISLAGYDIAKLRFVFPHDLPRFGLEFLQLIGIPPENIILHRHHQEHLQFDELVIPTILRTASRLHPFFKEASKAWTDRIHHGSAPPTGSRRLFISRKGVVSGRVLANRDALESIAVSAGFELVHPERLSLLDQIALFRRATHVVGEYGSGLHSTIFGSEELRCYALRGNAIAPGFVQSGLAHEFHQIIGYAFAPADAHAVDYTFGIDPQDFELGLQALELAE